jgi:uncharacterized SAM-binding protein YcdF (DUF218 family)
MNAKRGRWLVFSALLVLILIGVFRNQILWSLGAMLVNAGPPQKADIVVVLGGDWEGNRILKGAELVREGYAPRVLLSGSGGMYGHYECDLAVEYAASKGYPRDEFIPLHYSALNTVDETRADIRELHKLGVHRVLLVTSEFHTARAGRIFRREAEDMEVHVVASPTPEWENGYWWKEREGRKTWLSEFEKTIADFFRI